MQTTEEGLPLRLRLCAADQPGFVLLPDFAGPGVAQGMLREVVAIARAAEAGRDVAPALVMEESQPGFRGERAEDRVSKVFRLHRLGPFRRFLAEPGVVRILLDAIGPDVDCFLSQFIFKNPGAWGQPWHQDAWYFAFEPARPVVGLWLAVTEATLRNGCLHVLPGSQREPVQPHHPDPRPGSLYGYMEVPGVDARASHPCLLRPGDLLVFDSHLLHRSTDNHSSTPRAAMVWHLAVAGTRDRGVEGPDGRFVPSPVHDWMPVLRGGDPVIG